MKIFDTKTRSKQNFVPLTKDKVGLYVCGITVYDHCHIGHARTWIAFDMIVRYLRFSGYKVNFVRNITDIDDKIINRANENNEDPKQLAERYIISMHEDAKNLKLISPDSEPKATEFMPQMITLVQKLVDKKFAYIADNGDVYYAVHKFDKYGQISRRKIHEETGYARIEENQLKRDDHDFALWKSVKPGEPSWKSPWGKGRPGWHLECSAMSMELLGESFDIHGGGFDLIFPHHENECAQSEAATDKEFAKYWMHVGFLQINQEKMSKSLGNIATIKEVLSKIDVETLRYFMISGHYRSPLEYSLDLVKNCRSSVERLYTAMRNVNLSEPMKDTEFEKRFIAAMDDDFNTPEAIAVLFDLVKYINKTDNKGPYVSLLQKLGNSIGLLQTPVQEFFQSDNVDADNIEKMITLRNKARAEKNWAEADRIRDELLAVGIELEDSAVGTIWKFVG